MTTQARQDAGALAQRKVARKYKLLGYEVLESPGADRLPEFMQGMRPDIVARSALDNVVIEVKPHSALKGANDLVDMAERVSGHPDWRFELVVSMRASAAGSLAPGRAVTTCSGRSRLRRTPASRTWPPSISPRSW